MMGILAYPYGEEHHPLEIQKLLVESDFMKYSYTTIYVQLTKFATRKGKTGVEKKEPKF